ncbi:MAG: hypothetical protein AB2588_16205, partial [Candidatus Thiodiazotropha sp.]
RLRGGLGQGDEPGSVRSQIKPMMVATGRWPVSYKIPVIERGPVNIQSINIMNKNLVEVWKNKLYWALPLFFLIKGLLWLAVPLISAVYALV